MKCWERFKMRLFRQKSVNLDAGTPLKRCLSILDLAMIGASNMIGAAVYVLSGVVAREKAGPGVVLSYLFAGFAMLLSSLCYAEFGARIPKAGSAFTFTYTTLGEVYAFIIGWDVLLERMLSAAANAKGWSTMFDSMFNNAIENDTIAVFGSIHMLGFSPSLDFVALGVTILCGVVVSVGIKVLTNCNLYLTIVNIISLIIVIMAGYCLGSFKNWTVDSPGGFLPFGMEGVFAGTATLFYTFVGFESITNAAEEAIDPSRQMPIAIISAMVCTCILYLGASSSLTLLVPWDTINIQAPFPDAFRQLGVTWAVYLVAVGALLGIGTSVLLDLFSLTRNVYAMAADGLIFRIFSNVNSLTRTPLIATIVFGLAVGTLALLIDYVALVACLSIGTLISFTAVAICVIVARYSITELPLISTRTEFSKVDPDDIHQPIDKPTSTDSDNNDNHNSEKSSMLQGKPEQKTGVGGPVLRDCFQQSDLLVRYSGKPVFYITILTIVGCSGAMSLMFRYKNDIPANVISWGVVICTAGILISVGLMCMFKQTNVPTTFSVSKLAL